MQLAERDYDARDATATECNRLVEACDGELNAERWAAAKAKIEEALPLMTLTGEAGDRKRATLLQRLGIATAKLGDKEGALKVFAEAIELLDKYPKADLGLREALSQWVVGLSPKEEGQQPRPEGTDAAVAAAEAAVGERNADGTITTPEGHVLVPQYGEPDANAPAMSGTLV